MKLKDYAKDHLIQMLLYLLLSCYVVLLLYGFDVDEMLCIHVGISLLLLGVVLCLVSYGQKNKFLKELEDQVDKLDQKYLICDLMEEPYLYEYKKLMDILYEINKSMNDHLKEYQSTIHDFKEYIELWVHEIKIPLAAAELMIANNRSAYDLAFIEEIQRIENLVEQVLFYVRSENVEKDYLIKEVDLKNVMNQVVRKHRRSFIYKKIQLKMDVEQMVVKTDAKWLEFIVGQIIANSIKYTNKENAWIKIDVCEFNARTVLVIEDNGIGIAEKDIHRVFEKGFTGENGRKQYNSTGLGLYLCKSLCQKMNHEIKIESVLHEGTKISIVFPEYKSMNVMKR